jgi:hypothetical protein
MRPCDIQISALPQHLCDQERRFKLETNLIRRKQCL